MSSDIRLKKLRGSGGYVMASVDDDQQRKGNLGGPDLFLAPIGRLSSEKISKYFCNTCERDYEGSPKIEYENPNEEVADNLILLEKGQYVCTTCGSTLAEYREFKKPDEMGDVGMARPTEPSLATQFEAPAESFQEPNMEIETPPSVSQDLPSVETPIPDFDAQESFSPPQSEISTQPEISQTPSISQSPGGSISSIVGMSVLDENAKKIGTAKQVGVDASQSLVLVVTRDDGTELSIPWNQISKVGDVVLLGPQGSYSPPSQIPAAQEGKCSSCGFDNKVGSKFCEQCGSKI